MPCKRWKMEAEKAWEHSRHLSVQLGSDVGMGKAVRVTAGKSSQVGEQSGGRI